eukprot:TRINITY_DN17231_c0_g1_i1.p1 TRINITY_DN17231_c0_g1~~TRINITY_DN17231_c0_g1_i1.p1  ORF type:complete len:147 (+),score=33.95 TRINITY_DN17231_c0_g1_i1:283-723(+)
MTVEVEKSKTQQVTKNLNLLKEVWTKDLNALRQSSIQMQVQKEEEQERSENIINKKELEIERLQQTLKETLEDHTATKERLEDSISQLEAHIDEIEARLHEKESEIIIAREETELAKLETEHVEGEIKKRKKRNCKSHGRVKKFKK